MNQTIRSRLTTLAEPEYRDFAAGLIPDCREMLGVRLPLLRHLARELCRGDWRAALAGEDRYFEERMLRGLIVAGAPVSTEERLALVREFVPLIDNWSVCDSFCSSLREMRAQPERWWPLVREAAEASPEFTARFGIVSILDHFLDTAYLPEVLSLLPRIENPAFYVRMAVGWALAEAFLRTPESVLALLQDQRLEPEIHRITIQKLLDSRRVGGEYRQHIRALRRPDQNNPCFKA